MMGSPELELCSQVVEELFEVVSRALKLWWTIGARNGYFTKVLDLIQVPPFKTRQ